MDERSKMKKRILVYIIGLILIMGCQIGSMIGFLFLTDGAEWVTHVGTLVFIPIYMFWFLKLGKIVTNKLIKEENV